MEKINWTDSVRNEEELHRIKEDGIILHKINRRKLTGLVTTCIDTVF